MLIRSTLHMTHRPSVICLSHLTPFALQDEIAKNWLQAFDQVRCVVVCSGLRSLYVPVNIYVASLSATDVCFLVVLLFSLLLVQLIALSQPSVIALHCQEMGGKNFRQSMKEAAEFGQ